MYSKYVLSKVSTGHANVEKMAKSNIRILGSKSLSNIRKGSEALSIVREMLQMFARNFEIL